MGTDTAPPAHIRGESFRHLLVCLDGSKEAEAVLPLARHFATEADARVTLAEVLDSTGRPEARVTEAIDLEIARCEARCYLESLAESFGSRAAVRVLEGPMGPRIVHVAGEVGADLLVLGTHEATDCDLPRDPGSHTQRILAFATGSLLLVPSAQNPARVPPERILVWLDGSARAESVLPTAERIARSSDAEVVLAHVVAEPSRSSVLCLEEDIILAQELSHRLHKRAEAYLGRLRERLRAAGTRARVRVDQSPDPTARLADLARSERADLVVVSAHGCVCDPRHAYGREASYLIEHAPAPMLILQDLPSAVLQQSRGQRPHPGRENDVTSGHH
jgi:nucleotide-binding universal stress UspA family protein